MMEVTYEAVFEPDSKPRLCKVVADSSGAKILTALSLSNAEELTLLSEELIWTHMNNLVEYIKVLSDGLSLVPQGVQPNDGWPVVGWQEVYKTHEEIMSWWIYLVNREETFEVIHHLTIQP